jgi:Protein of unknown function (DUF2795)
MTLKKWVDNTQQKEAMYMNLDLGPLNPVLSQVQFPISKDDLVKSLQQKGVSNEVVSQLQRLPDKTFNSPLDVQNALGGLGNIGNIKL